MKPIRDELIDERAIELEKIPLSGGRTRHRIVALRNPYMTLFTPDEQALVDSVIRELWAQTAEQVSDASHDVRWRVVNMLDPMPYEFTHFEDGITEYDVNRTRELIREYGAQWGLAGA